MEYATVQQRENGSTTDSKKNCCSGRYCCATQRPNASWSRQKLLQPAPRYSICPSFCGKSNPVVSLMPLPCVENKWVDWSRGFCSCVTSGFHEHEGLSFQMSSPAVQSLCSCPYYGPIAATILCGWSNSEQFKFGMAPTDPIDSNRPYSLCQYTTAYHSHTHGNRFDVQAVSAWIWNYDQEFKTQRLKKCYKVPKKAS